MQLTLVRELFPAIKWYARIYNEFLKVLFQYYGTEHPLLGVHLMKFGKIMIEIKNGKEADEMLRVSFYKNFCKDLNFCDLFP